MSVIVTLIGRLGNNLFQYAFGRIIAEQLQLELDCHQRRSGLICSIAGQPLDFGNTATLSELAASFPNAPLHMSGQRVFSPVESYELRDGEWQSQMIDLSAILRNATPRQIRLRGWFQRFEYYSPYRRQLREWFRPRPIPAPFKIHPKDVLINIRRGADYGLRGWTLPLSYYENILSSLVGLRQVYVCGTCIDEAVRTRLERYKPIYYSGNPIEQFCFIMSFNRIILSNSTFAWWAGFLSDAETIFAPRSSQPHVYSFTGFEGVDLHMRENRYVEIPMAGTVRFGLFIRNMTLNIHYEDSGRLLLIVHPGGKAHVITVDDSNRDLLDWLLHQSGRIMLREIAQRYHGSKLQQVIDECLRSSLLVLDPGYVDFPVGEEETFTG